MKEYIMKSKALQHKLSSVKNLPALPKVVGRVLQLLQNPDSTAFEVAKAISQDQALSSKILRAANSAFYGFPGKITTINYAIVVLGLNNIKNIVLSTAVFAGFGADSQDSGFDRRAFWEHSLACGMLAGKIALHLDMKNTEEVFMWGLLHDFGKVVLDNQFHKEFIEAVELAENEQIPLRTAESRIFGFNHAGVGALLLRKWSLPISLVNAVEFHHDPEAHHSSFRIASIVHVADYLCRRIGIGSSGNTVLPTLNKAAWQLMGLTSEQVKEMSRQVMAEFQAATEFLADPQDGGRP